MNPKQGLSCSITTAQNGDMPVVRHLWESAFHDDSPQWVEHFFQNIYRPENAFLFQIESEAAGAVHHFHIPLTMRDQLQQGTFFYGLSVHPAYRGMGVGKLLTRHIVEEAAKQKSGVVLLIPAHPGYYASMGFDWCYGLRYYALSLDALKASPAIIGPPIQWGKIREIADPDSHWQDFNAVYQTWSSDWQSKAIRSAKRWHNFFQDIRGEGGTCFLLRQNDDPAGYLTLWQKGDTITIREMAWKNPDACRQLLYTLWQYRSQAQTVIWYAPADDKTAIFLSREKQGYLERNFILGRVTDLSLACNDLLMPDSGPGELFLEIQDPLLPQNQGLWRLSWQQGHLHAEKLSQGTAELSMDIGAFSACYLGYYSPAFYHMQGRITGKEASLTLFEQLFPPCANYYYDYL